MKRRFGLDRLFSKLDETTKAEAALVILAMNASLRLVCWLALFFRSTFRAYTIPCFSAAPKYAPITITGHPLNTRDSGDFKAESDK